ncbi:MAG TPA: hydroxylamine reductase, partial [Verrucomicrobiota bacterium]|nr:hydroxylamine reductase [Verrucomicrobiota bacterium]
MIRKEKLGDDITGLQELLLYGMKGTAAYAEHARMLGRESDEVYEFFHIALDYLTVENPTVETLFNLCMRCGEINLKVMEMLDGAHTSTYGHPVPTKVRITPVKGKAIV